MTMYSADCISVKLWSVVRQEDDNAIQWINSHPVD